jgi:acetate kinase
MYVLVINCGSSSLKAALLDHASGAPASAAKVERIGEGEVPDHTAALTRVLPELLAGLPEGATLAAVGHRVVHGGAELTAPIRIDDDVEATIERLAALAPLHNPANLAGIRAARARLPDVPHVAVFDTAFHATLTPRARTYGLPYELAEAHDLRRFGFHGTSHAYAAGRAAEHLRSNLRDLRVVTCHLGSGCSVAAVEFGCSVETSMGMTPLEGLVMGTRCGDVDPGVLLHLARRESLTLDELDELLNRRSGLKGISGVGNDMRDIEERAAAGDERCRMAIRTFCHRVRKYIGAYAAVMGGVDAIVFTAGIGENSALVRNRIAQRLEFLGARLDDDANRSASVSREAPVAEISEGHSRCRLLVVATDEQHAIARDAAKVVRGLAQVPTAPPIPISVSARHIHLSEEHVQALFGGPLTVRKPLSQPGQWIAEQRLTLVGPKRTLERVGIIGPPRSKTQIEISRTDEYHLGLDAPIRCSGDVDGTPGIVVEGPNGRLLLEQGVIQAQRHIHMTPADAKAYGVNDRDVVEVAVDSEGRDLVFGDVLVRVKASYLLDMHIDTDEANAADLGPGATGMLMPLPGSARILRRRTDLDVV